jgi:hypothetical protein
MNIESFQQMLSEVYNGSQDPVAQHTAQEVNQYTEMFKAGQLSKEEYLQLVEDLQSTAIINKNMDNMETLQYMNTAINGLISIAKLA